MYQIVNSFFFLLISINLLSETISLSPDAQCLEIDKRDGKCLEDVPKGEKYIFLQEITRHGTRTAFSNLITRDWMKPYGIGELTAPGFRQHWILGNALREAYSSFFTHRFSLSEIWTRSTGFDRTVQSGNAHLQGIFHMYPTEPILNLSPDNELNLPVWTTKGFDFYKYLNFDTALPQKYEPYPVWTPSDGHFDRFLKADDEGGLVCNATYPLRAQATENLTKYINSSRLLQDTCKEAYKRYNIYDQGIEDYGFNLTNSFFISDAVLCLHENDPNDLMDMSNPKDSEFYTNIKKVYSLYIFSFYNNTEYSRTVQTPILENVRNNINQKANIAMGNTDPSTNLYKYVLLSAHDSTIAQIFLNNGLFDSSCLINEFMDGIDRNCDLSPGPSSSFVIELVQKHDEKKILVKEDLILRFNYNGNYVDFCKLGNKGSSGRFDCSLGKFNKIIDSMVVGDFDKACFGPVVPGIAEVDVVGAGFG